MPRRRKPRDGVRRAIAAEAARIVAEEAIEDYQQAKRRAVKRLGLEADTQLPANAEVDAALRLVQEVYGGEERRAHLRRLREGALEAMHHLRDFRPRLVGPVLEGTADRHSAIQLHVFADYPEQFAWFLEEHGIPHDQEETTIRLERDRGEPCPVFRFEAGGLPYDIVCLPMKALRQPPVSGSTGRSVRRASAHGVRELLNESGAAVA